MEGSTDAGNIDDELVMVQYCALDHDTQEVRSVSRLLSVEVPLTVNADGLIQCFQISLKKLGVVDVYDAENVLAADAVLVGVSTDGAAVNISEINGMKDKMQSKLPWLMWQWCYGHRVELACKDALCSKVIKNGMELLLRLYYLYHKSPKKLRELEDIIADLREAYSFPIGGNVPVRCSGTRWIAHKCKALQRFIDRYGVHVNHLSTLATDRQTMAEDKARLKGYVFKMKNYKILVGTAMYLDLLQPVHLLSLSL